MRALAASVLVLSVLALMFMLLFNVFVEPGPTGSIGCGQVWESPAPSEFPDIDEDCRQAIDTRRWQVMWTALVVCASAGVLLASYRWRQDAEVSDGRASSVAPDGA